MEVFKFDTDDFKNILLSCLNGGGLIPVIGAGFSRGSKSKEGKVPDGNELISIMLKTLKRANLIERTKLDKIDKTDFKSVSSYYLKEKYVPREMFSEDLRKYFTKVDIEGVRRIFLKQDWDYIYTLNIDDAIERANNKLDKVVPYRQLEKKTKDIKLLYKIHGCATDEIIYKEDSKLVFSEKQYLRSLTRNEHILSSLKNDMLESNFIYLGCSLERELDIMYAISGVKENELINSKRIYITKDVPDEIQLDKLEDYGINVVCLLDEYDDIYHLINECFASSNRTKSNPLSLYDSSRIQSTNRDKNTNIGYMLQGEGNQSGEDKYFKVPYYLSERHIMKNILLGIPQNEVVIIKGRRFSGKSLLLKTLTSKIKDRKSFFFPSVTSLNADEIKTMASIKNVVYFIDSNVITYIEATEIRNVIKELKKNNTTFVIACNPTEIDISNTFLTLDNENNYFELSNYLNETETNDFNFNLSALGIIDWNTRLNILENTFNAANIYKNIEQKILIPKDISDTEFKLFIMLAVLDKVYISVSREIGIGNNEARELLRNYSPVIELLQTTELERNHKSSLKIVTNSKAWLLKIISDEHVKIGANSTSRIIKMMIEEFANKKQLEDIGKKLIMFDTINQLFSRKKGAGRLILKLYEDLQPLLNRDPDYWLQRAKAMGKVLNDKNSLRDAIDFAKKAFEDGKRTKTVINAEFTLANLYGKICNKSNYQDRNLIFGALNWYSSAIRNNSYNQSYINSMLEITKDKKGDLYTLCQTLIGSNIKLSSEEQRMFNEIYRFIRSV